MKIEINRFLDLFYSILTEDEIESINILDIIEVIKILFSSDDFELLSKRLDINEFTDEQILNHKYTEDIDENGIVYFNVPDDEANKLLEEYKVDAGFIQHAITKRAMAKYIEAQTNGNIEFKYDSPNGVYNLPNVDLPDYKCETKLFSDGDYANNTYYKGNEASSSTRTIKVNNATFSIMLFYIDGLVDKGEIRGLYHGGDYSLLYNELKRLRNNINESYNEVVKERPKVYKFKRH